MLTLIQNFKNYELTKNFLDNMKRMTRLCGVKELAYWTDFRATDVVFDIDADAYTVYQIIQSFTRTGQYIDMINKVNGASINDAV